MSMIKVHDKTKKQLDSIKHKGQTYDGIISELTTFYKKAQNEVATIR